MVKDIYKYEKVENKRLKSIYFKIKKNGSRFIELTLSQFRYDPINKWQVICYYDYKEDIMTKLFKTKKEALKYIMGKVKKYKNKYLN